MAFGHGRLDELRKTALLVLFLLDDEQAFYTLMVLNSSDSLFYFALKTIQTDIRKVILSSNSFPLTIALLSII